MNKFIFYITLAICLISMASCSGQNADDKFSFDEEYNIPTSQMYLRDPFIYADESKQRYYIVHPKWIDNVAAIVAYESKDLKHWKNLGTIWRAPSGFLANSDGWAPDLFEYKGEHYIFITYSRKKNTSNTNNFDLANYEIKRGTTVLKSISGPIGPYSTILPLERLNFTPSNMMALDGYLYIDEDDQPWMIYSGELTQFYAGRVYIQKMKKDLSDMEGDPILLFDASESGWAQPSGEKDGKKLYIVDAPVLYKDSESGNLIMVWSSTTSSGYTMGQAISKSGKITGPWTHEKEVLNSDDGGHSMIFRNLKGDLKISYHSTNFKTTKETVTIRDITIKDGKIQKIN